jgi:probable phosphomutase (TIGR03848 family)
VTQQTILLIRHGRAEFKAGHLYGWTPGVVLSEAGRDEAKRLGERLADVKLTAAYSSPLERATETAEISLAGRKLPVQIVDGVGEVKYGKWQGRSYKSLVKTPLWRVVQRMPSQARFPGGESLLEMQRRGVDAIEAIRAKHKKGTIAVFSHADMIKALLAHYLGLHLDLFQRLNVDTASVSVIAFFNDFPRVLRIGDTGDLSMLSPPAPPKKKPREKAT